MKQFLPFLFLLPLTSGCFESQPLQSGPPNNNFTYTVEYLFEHEGCKVYRFYDRGNYVYFTNCNGEAIAKTDSTEVRNAISVKGGTKALRQAPF